MAIDKVKILEKKIAELEKQKAIAILEKEIEDIKAGKTVPERIIYIDRFIIGSQQKLPEYPIRPNWYCDNIGGSNSMTLCVNGDTHLSLN